MSTIIFFGNTPYDLDTKEGNKAFVDAIRHQSLSVPAGIQDLLFMSVKGTGTTVKKQKRRFDDAQ